MSAGLLGNSISGRNIPANVSSLSITPGGITQGDGVNAFHGVVECYDDLVCNHGLNVATGNASVAGTSTLTGAVACGATLGVAGASTLTGAVACGATFDVAGASTLTGGAVMPVPAVISADITLTSAQSGATFAINKTANVVITLPAVASMAGVSYKFVMTTIGGATTAIIRTNPTGNFFRGTITNDTGTIVGNGTTLTFSATAVAGDSIELAGVNGGFILARCASSAAAGITVA